MKRNASTFLTEEQFWQVISRSLDGTDSVGLSAAKQQQLLERELQRLSRDEFVGFLWHFIALVRRAYRNDLWAVAYVVMGGCSDDCFMDFRTWLVTRGKSVYQAALHDPDSLCNEFDKIPQGDIPLWEYYPQMQFNSRFGEDAFDVVGEQYDFGEAPELADPENQWSHDDEDSIRRLCPTVFNKWWENLVF